MILLDFFMSPYSLMVKHGLGKTELPGQYRVRAPRNIIL